MRTTLDLDEQLLARAREVAAERRTTLTAIVEEALASLLAPRPVSARRFRLRWKTHRGRYLGGVDVADRQALYDLMENDR